jgi:hypothetical protein
VRVNISDAINNAPNAIAGSSQTVNAGARVTLDGRQSNDPDGDALTYQWTQNLIGPVSDPPQAVVLSGANTARATFTAPTLDSDELLTFTLTVTDPNGLSDQATANVTVRRQGSGGGGNGGGAFSWIWLLILLGTRAGGRVITAAIKPH